LFFFLSFITIYLCYFSSFNATDSRTDNNIITHLKLVRGRDRCHAVAAAAVVVYVPCAFFSFPLSSIYIHNIIWDNVASRYPLDECFSRSATTAVFFVFTFFFVSFHSFLLWVISELCKSKEGLKFLRLNSEYNIYSHALRRTAHSLSVSS